MTERVQIVGPYGEKGTVDATDLQTVIDQGGRVATPKEVAAQHLAEQYAAQSTAKKVGGVLSSTLAGPVASNALDAGGFVAMQPEVAALTKGMASPLTMGIDRVATKAALEAVSGKEAGHAYAQQQAELSAAHGGWETAGEVAGMAALIAAGKPSGLARMAPGMGLSALGGAVESGVARGVAGLAGRGALGRAGATAIALGAQGGVEGALMGAANQMTEDYLGDHEQAADRVFAATGMGALYGALGGAVLGGGGSLAKSGVGAVGGGIARLARGASGEGAELAAKAGAAEAKLAAGEAKAAAAEARATSEAGELVGTKARKATAFMDDAANSLAFDALGTTKKIARKIDRDVQGGTKAVGEYVNRRILQGAEHESSLIGGVMGGRADEMLPRIKADRAALGAEIGDVVKGTPVRVHMDEVLKPGAKLLGEMSKDPARIGATGQLSQQLENLTFALKNKGAIAADGTVDLSELYYARASMEGVAREFGAAGQKTAKRGVQDWLRDVDGVLVDRLDEAAKAAGKAGEKEKLLALKRDYHLSAAAEKAAQDGADRIAGNNIFGLREGIAAGVGLTTAIGSEDPILGVLGAGAVALGGRFMRQRGAAAGAILLSKMAQMGTISRIINGVNEQVDRSARGLLTEGTPRGGVPSRNPVDVARRAEKQIAELTARPESVAERATTVTQGMSQVAPTVAGNVSASLTRSLAFLSSKLPPERGVDPLAPGRKRAWNTTEATKFARYVEAAEDPMGVLKDVESGKVTREGVETLKVLTPTLYRDLQVKTMDAIADQLAKGKPIPYEKRLKLGTLLDIPADPSLQPRVMAFLQSNVVVQATAPGTMQSSPGGKASRPIDLKTQHSAFDRLSEGVGRR